MKPDPHRAFIFLIVQENQINPTIENLFRNEYGKVISILTHKYGTSHVEEIEDATQEAFVKAMRVWAYKEVPDNPTGWLFRVANNQLLDQFRRHRKLDFKEADQMVSSENGHMQVDPPLDHVLLDSQLQMIFACCHPKLPREHQIVLSLKLIGGFSNLELAQALFKKEDTVAKLFTRAKNKFRESVKMVRIPVEMGLQSRLFQVLQVIYLMFSEGYEATTGSKAIKKDICYEALRLATLLKANKFCQHPNLDALIALMCFHAARFEARIDDKGELVTLEQHDRSLYDQRLIAIGIQHLENAGTSDKLPSNYHLEAARSFYHSSVTDFAHTDWKSILYLYDVQLRLFFTPTLALNRIVALEKVQGAAKAYTELQLLVTTHNVEDQALYYGILAELLSALDRKEQQKQALGKAIGLSTNELVKKHYEKKLALIQ